MSQVTEPIALDSTLKGVKSELSQIKTILGRGSHVLFGFHVDPAESDPAACVTYLEDAVGMTPAYMDFANSKFNYGSWENAFFMPRPCMVYQTGGVAYYLDPNDFTKKEDGTASDVGDSSFAGNVMIEWGQNGKKIWHKFVPDADGEGFSFYVSDERLDDDYKAWSFINNQGREVDHFYTPAYNGSKINGELRSISGQAVMNNETGTNELTYALANNKDTNVCWYGEVLADRILIGMLLVLMAKNLDTQTAYGNGLATGSQTAFNNYRTGALNAAGMFFGYSDQTHAVKVFGMENFWGLQWRRTAGDILSDGIRKIKLTYGRQDGSEADGYNSDGSGYISLGSGSTPSGTSGGYITKMIATRYGAFFKEAGGTGNGSNKYYCDGGWFNNSGARYALYGASSTVELSGGLFACALHYAVGAAYWTLGRAVSYKPLA